MREEGDDKLPSGVEECAEGGLRAMHECTAGGFRSEPLERSLLEGGWHIWERTGLVLGAEAGRATVEGEVGNKVARLAYGDVLCATKGGVVAFEVDLPVPTFRRPGTTCAEEEGSACMSMAGREQSKEQPFFGVQSSAWELLP